MSTVFFNLQTSKIRREIHIYILNIKSIKCKLFRYKCRTTSNESLVVTELLIKESFLDNMLLTILSCVRNTLVKSKFETKSANNVDLETENISNLAKSLELH